MPTPPSPTHATPSRWWLPSLAGYQRKWLVRDAIAGATLFSIAIPEQLATSRLAGVGAFTALWAFVAATIAFAVIGTHRRLSLGADSTIAPLFAASLAGIAVLGSAHYLGLAAVLALEVGVVLALVGLFRLGWVADFFSVPIVTGFMGGVAVIIVVHQLPDLLGLPPTSGSTVHRLTTVVTSLGSTNLWDLGIGLAVLGLVLGTELINRRIPGALIGLVGSTILVSAAGLAGTVAVLGTVHAGLPHPSFDGVTWSEVGGLIPLALAVAVICLSQTVATIRAFPGGHRDRINANFLGLGAANLLAGLFGTFPVNASPARTAVVGESGGRTQLGGLLTAVGVVILVPFVAILTDVPLAALAGVLIWVALRIFRYRDLRVIVRFDRWEGALAVATMIIVSFVGVQIGILVAIGLAIADRSRLSARPHTYQLGRVDGTTSWAPVGVIGGGIPVPDVVVFFFAAPLYFANASAFTSAAVAAIDAGTGVEDTKLFVLDAAAIGDIDFTGTQALGHLLDRLDEDKVAFALARGTGGVPANLAASGLSSRIGPGHLFATVDEAVEALGQGSARPIDAGPES